MQNVYIDFHFMYSYGEIRGAMKAIIAPSLSLQRIQKTRCSDIKYINSCHFCTLQMKTSSTF